MQGKLIVLIFIPFHLFFYWEVKTLGVVKGAEVEHSIGVYHINAVIKSVFDFCV